MIEILSFEARSRAAGVGRPHRLRTLGFAAIALLAAGCASFPDLKDAEAVAEYRETNDPAEPTMRAIFAVNQVLDKAFIRPAAVFYKEFLPPVFQRAVRNVLDNLRAPVVFFNDVLQGKPSRAGTTLARFAINSTAGVLGLRDQAAEWGLAAHTEDFGQTLAVWGLGEGPYLVLPVFGPSNPRDAVGLAVDFLIDPLNRWAVNVERDGIVYGRGLSRGVDERARNYDVLEDLERTSLDLYATLRSLYRQRRNDEIRDGEISVDLPAPSLGSTPNERGAHELSRAQ